MSDVEWKHVNVALRELTPWERNPRRISKKNAERLLDLWRRIGQFQTIAIGPNGEVYDGHQRLSVLKAAFGDDYCVQALRSSRPLTEKEREELVVAAHVGTVGQFDWEALSGWDVDELQAWGFDIETLEGWQTDAEALGSLLADAHAIKVEDVPVAEGEANEIHAKWQVASGQLWHLGRHKLFCGDSTDPAVVARVTAGERIDGICTDPPYDLSAETITKAFEYFANVAVVLCSDSLMVRLANVWDFHLGLVWKRRQPRAYPTPHMPVLYHSLIAVVTRPGDSCNWKRPRPDYSSVIEVEREFVLDEHGHGKGKDVFVEMLAGFDWKTVADPFVGSGATILACEETGRKCVACEIDPVMASVCLERFYRATGELPVLSESAECYRRSTAYSVGTV